MDTQIAPGVIQTVFNRYEKKYLMTEPVYQELRKRLEPYMQVDMYGLTTILNLYFDTPDGLLVRRSNEMPVYKEKPFEELRIHAEEDGYISGIQADTIGHASVLLGAGRLQGCDGSVF